MNATVLPAEWIARARASAQQTDQALLVCLAQEAQGAGLSASALTECLGLTFGYRVLSMSELQAAKPRFDLLAFTDSTQRGVVLLETAPHGLVLVLSDPFDGASEGWALRRIGSQRVKAPQCALAHPAATARDGRLRERRRHHGRRRRGGGDFAVLDQR
jgi:hypothetical protein